MLAKLCYLGYYIYLSRVCAYDIKDVTESGVLRITHSQSKLYLQEDVYIVASSY